MNLTLILCLTTAPDVPDFIIPRLGEDSAYRSLYTRNQPGKEVDLGFRSTTDKSSLYFSWASNIVSPAKDFVQTASTTGVVGELPDGYPLGFRARMITTPYDYRIDTFLPDGIATLRFSLGTIDPKLDRGSRIFNETHSNGLIAFRQFCAKLSAYRAGNGDSFQAKVTKVEFQKVTKFETLDGVWPNASRVRIKKNGNELIFVLGALGYMKNGFWQDLKDAPIVKDDELFVPSSSLN